MANTRISDLTASASNLAASDLVPVVQTPNVGPVKMTGTQIKTGIIGAGSVSIASGKTFTASNTLTLAGTDSTTITFGSASSSFPIVTSPTAATLQLGAADTTGTTAPTAQFLRVQSWSSSTNNNQTGADFTIQGSRGTGTGAGGSIIFQVAPAGSISNGVQNGYSTALTIDSTKAVALGGNLILNGSGNGSGIKNQAGANYASLDSDGGYGFTFYDTNSTSTIRVSSVAGVKQLIFGSTALLAWGSTATASTGDLFLARDNSNILALRNGTNAQLFRVYSTYNGTNDAYGAIGAGVKLDGTYASGDENILYIGSQKKGSPTALTKLAIQVNGTTYLDYNITVGSEWATSSKIRASSFQTTSGDFLCASAAYIYWSSRAQMKSPADKVLVVEDSSANATIIQTKQFTVSNLPTASSYAGALAFVSDATSTTSRSTVAGGGSNKVMVMSDGTNWLIVA